MLMRQLRRAKVRNVHLTSLNIPRMGRKKGAKHESDSYFAPKRAKITPSRIPRPVTHRPDHMPELSYPQPNQNVADGTKALNLDPSKTRYIATIKMWTSALLNYASVYLSVHQNEIADLLHYIHEQQST